MHIKDLKMSTYRSVNFHELCRVCTAHTERRVNIFSADAKGKNLSIKIAECLPLKMEEKDRLPKFVCEQCLNQVEEFYSFRNICKNSQNMLNECLKRATQHSSGKVYIKDAIANSGKSLSVINNERQNNLNQCSSEVNVGASVPVNPNNNTDILNTIIQSIGGIQQTTDTSQIDKSQIQNYNVALENKGSSQMSAQTLKLSQTTMRQQKESSKIDVDHKALTEFLKMKPNIKLTSLGKSNGKKVEEVLQQQQEQPLQQPQPIQQQQHQSLQQQSLQQQQQPLGTFQHTQQLQFQQPQMQQIFQQPEQLVQLQQQLSASTTTTNTASIQLQQLQQQIQQFQLQQQLQQQIQQITSQLQPQQTITFSAPPEPGNDMNPSKNKKPKLNFVLTSPNSQTLTATLPQLAMTAGIAQQQPQIQLQLQSPQSQHQAAAATLFSNLAPFFQQQHVPQHQQTQPSANAMLQTPAATQMPSTTTATSLMPSPSKCYLPITIKDENSDQEFVAHIDAKNFMLPTTYQLQMKLQPQIATVDGQPIVQLTSSSIPATLQLAASALNNPAFQALANNNMLQALPSIHQQQQLQQHQQQQQQQVQMQAVTQQQQQTTMKPPPPQVTSQQIIRGCVQLTNDAATSTNDQTEDFIPINKQDTKCVIKQQRYRLTQQNVSGAMEITPTKLPLVQQQTKQSQNQQSKQTIPQKHIIQPLHQQQEMPDQRQQQQEQKHVPDSVTVQRITNTTTKHEPQQQHAQQQSISNTLPAKVPVLQKKDVTISRISNTPQTPQQQQQQQQALLKLLPPTKVEAKTNESSMPSMSQIKQLQIQRQETLAQQLQALICASSSQVKVPQKPTMTTLQQQQTQVSNTANNAAATSQATPQIQETPPTQATLPHATPITKTTAQVTTVSGITTPNVPCQNVQQQDTNATNETLNTAKVDKTQVVAAHGIGPNGTECSACGRVFKKKEHLTQHVKLHAGLRPFKCKEEQCGKAFSRKEHLMRHEISHSGRKLFSCDICHKPFSRKDNLNKHRRIHLTTTNVYTCEICTKQFVVKAYYEEHKQMHEDSDSPETAESNNEKAREQSSNNNTPTSNIGNIPQLNKLQQTQFSQQPQQQTQQQQYIQSTMTTIPTSLISSTHQPQTQQLQLVQQQQQVQQTGTTQYQQQQQQPQHQHIMQLQMPTVVSTQDLTGNTFTLTQSTNDPTSLKATIAGGGTHDATVLNLPSTLANLMQLSHAQFVNTATGQIMGHIKIDK
ncbi:putative uncharacterized protein DDB_G0271606 [Eurosta solidaginis]|uniref:putative uncharacterized protein DDB_G0271606 n=1 Tax=Eurosta solidaginis TaxID=178769 RepID=UPI003530906D